MPKDSAFFSTVKKVNALRCVLFRGGLGAFQTSPALGYMWVSPLVVPIQNPTPTRDKVEGKEEISRLRVAEGS